MAQRTKKLKEETKQKVIRVDRFLGSDLTSVRTDIEDGYFSSLYNADIYSSANGDYIQNRSPFDYLKKPSGPTKRATSIITNRITWDVGAEEYLITQESTAMYSQALITTGNPTQILLASGGAFALGSSATADLFISGDKLYVLHPSGNYVIRWTGTVFVAYSMGLAYPFISAVTSANTGVVSGNYTLGIEKVYQVSGVDLMASTPNRKMPTTRILATTGTISTKKIKVTIQATELDNDSLWTHLRFWRSKNKNRDITDLVNPIDAQGLDNELYEEALITKAEISAGALTSIATGSTLPPGNVGTQAGKPASVYTIEVNNLDAVFFNLIGIDRIELSPIPACTTGCFNANRIFFSGIQDAMLDDASKNNIWYTEYAGTKYAFQYNPLNFIDTGRDGQNMVKLISFEKDVIGFKEGKTGRIPSGNVNSEFQILDDKIGVNGLTSNLFIPTIGIVSITSDGKDLKVFGYDLRWSNYINEIEISKKSRAFTTNATSTGNFMCYHKGKLIISFYNTTIYFVLHVQEKKGMSFYVTPVAVTHPCFTFANHSRFAYIPSSSHLVELLGTNVDNYDINHSTDFYVAFIVQILTKPFISNKGLDIIEPEYLSLLGNFAQGGLSGTAGISGTFWPAGVAVPLDFIPSPSIYGSSSILISREYKLFIPPSTVGVSKWSPLAGNSIEYTISTTCIPCTIRALELHCIVDENGMGYGAFDPLQLFPTANNDPWWAQ